MIPFEKPVKFGLISGLILIVYSVLIYVADLSAFNPLIVFLTGIVTFGLLIVAAVLAINKMRDQDLGKKITYVQALIAGAVVIVVGMYLSAIWAYVFNGFIDPEYMARKVDEFLLSMEGNIPEEAFESMLENFETALDAGKSFVQQLWVSPIIAIVLSAIISIFIKKDKTQDQIN